MVAADAHGHRSSLRGRSGAAAAALAVVLGASTKAEAFCRTTTCDSKTQLCPRDASGCLTVGAPLTWDTQCLSYGVHEAASPRQQIDYDAASSVAADAFRAWLNADCGAGTPSLRVWDVSLQAGPPTCGHSEFNACAPNANVIFFREGDWPYEGAANVLAYTNVTFVPSTGRILDADIEINAATSDLTLTGEPGRSDLASLLTHEVGHFLGLDHTLVPGATMVERLSGTTEMRSLEPDDVLGICTVYPPGAADGQCSSPQLVHGFTRHCVQTAEEADEPPPETSSCRMAAEASGCSCHVGPRARAPHHGGGVGLCIASLVVLRRRLRRGAFSR